MKFLLTALLVGTLSLPSTVFSQDIVHGADCVPCEGSTLTSTCTIKVAVNLFASKTGYFEIDGCEGVNPTLHLRIGKTYLFDQKDVSNWYHLVGFAYEADGAHVPVDELEPGVQPPGSNSSCADALLCPAPMYYMDGKYMGEYSNIAELSNGNTTGSDNFGLDEVEPRFFHPIGDWQSYGIFKTYLKWDVPDFTQDIFYFCHVHSGMSARIKFMDEEGVMLNPGEDNPPIPYDYVTVSPYDQECGTYNLTDWQLPNDQCVERFVCDEDQSAAKAVDDPSGSVFKGCVDTMNCHMMASMTTQGDNIPALFCRQMIPHHENAINMAKSLLKHTADTLSCDVLQLEEGDVAPLGCELIPLLRDIVNVQNSQIIDMESVLEILNKDLYEDCLVEDMGTMDVGRRDQEEEGGDAPVYEHAIECTPCADSDGVCAVMVKVDFYTSALGHYVIDGCEGVNPTLLLEVGRTYKFDQSDISNWYHLIGFAYEADGAHVPVDELEPGIPPPGTDSTCAETNSCPAPMYFMGLEYQGTYSNNPDLVQGEAGSDDFGLDAVEPLFFHPIADWQEYGPMETYLKFDVDMPMDFFYFCHIHSGMSGRAKLVDANGNKLSEENTPELPYEYDVITPFDDSCGGFDLHQWQLPHPQCPSQFVCGVDDLPTQILTEEGGGATPMMSQNTFATCVDSMNCFMLNGMTTNYGGEELTNGGTHDVVLFLRQMIPHHQNAVNMAKALMKSNTATCGDLAIEEGSSVAVGCLLEPIGRGIINTQNHQIQTMKGLLEFVGAKESNDCKIGGHEEMIPDDEKEMIPDDEEMIPDDEKEMIPDDESNEVESGAVSFSFGAAIAMSSIAPLVALF